MMKISVKNLPELYAKIAEENSLYIPINNKGNVNFKKWEQGALVDLDRLKTVKSAKDVFFPQSQDLVNFEVNGKEIKVGEQVLPTDKQVIFGVRGCDAKSFEILDMAFLEDFGDKFYEARRENTTIITLACGRPDEACFCKVYGIDAADPKGDITTWIVDGYLYWMPNNDKGYDLTAKVKDLFALGNDDDKVEAYKTEIRSIIDKLPYSHLNLKGFDAEHLMEKFDSKKWNELSEACLGCGTCTFVCPTCQCYDIKDFKTNKGVERFRCWDSCMFSDFTKCAHGNPRTTQLQRFRQRFMHKLVYFHSNHGVYSCVGCGRCVQKCPSMLNIVKVIKALGEDNKDE
ncbi:MAG: 4Fe-4S ferredoxin [Clostridiales bacterium]|nr:4Fe-4S ferredoxin [Clostridiales bacterium]